MKGFSLKIATPDGLLFDGTAESLLVRTVAGDAEILSGHTDFWSALDVGRVRIIADGNKRFASASGGVISVSGGAVSLVCTTFEFADAIDVNRAKKAKEKAAFALEASKDSITEAVFKAKLARAENRIRVWELGR